ncbi:MAG: ABC transporter substrate-binding protein, partial [Marinilabiliales bacterium]
MICFVGLDDTDNKDSRGTGFKSRQLGKLIVEKNLGEVESISRHQLFVHEKIAFTS